MKKQKLNKVLSSKFLGVKWTGEPLLNSLYIMKIHTWLFSDMKKFLLELENIPRVKILFNDKILKIKRDFSRLMSLKGRLPSEYFLTIADIFKSISEMVEYLRKQNLLKKR